MNFKRKRVLFVLTAWITVPLLTLSLARLFGADASVDPTTATEIDRFLAASAGRGEGRAAEAQPRITSTRWFRHRHDEVSAAVFRSPSVKAAANCAACHPGAAADFNEHAARIPR